MIRNALKLAILGATVFALVAAAPASAVTITGNGTATSSGGLKAGTTATFTAAGLTISCTVHNTTAPVGSGGTASTSSSIPAATNVYGGVCTYTFLGSSGTASVTVNQPWTITAATLTSGTISVPNNSVTVTLTKGPLAGCSITVNASTVPVNWTQDGDGVGGNLSTYAGNAVATTSCLGNVVATQQETIRIDTITVS